MISEQKKESIITEYLTTEISFRALGQKHGIDFRMIHEWVQRYKGKMRSKPDKPKRVKPIKNPDELPSDVKLLQAELRKARLLNEVLTEVINITEVELGRSIRKKSGTKRS
ncbi:MAG: transposase [Flavobacterium sp.]|jgi:transposase-like protein|uniref:transposase n=1 Tax=Flavobacterium sp. TaxID=239 RepID=UPI0022C7B6AF|nr:transposase [Silanimonas sp.]